MFLNVVFFLIAATYEMSVEPVFALHEPLFHRRIGPVARRRRRASTTSPSPDAENRHAREVHRIDKFRHHCKVIREVRVHALVGVAPMALAKNIVSCRL
jgi:tRNA G26 N,N-dimethylase Trm1